MKNILFVGQNPVLHTGNGNMLAAVLAQVDDTKYKVASFISGGSQIGDPFELSNVINAEESNDGFGFNKLLRILRASSSRIDYLVMVGLDIWVYAPIFNHILEIKKEKPFRWVAIFPWDLYQLRADWIRWINCVDIPCVYSKYGYKMLKDHVPALQYFKPPLWKSGFYKQYSPGKVLKTRHKYFKELSDSHYIIGCVAKNQIRKDIPKFVDAFLSAKKENPRLVLYLHTELSGVYNLKQMVSDMGAKTGDVIAKKQGVVYSEGQMADIYNSIDCFVNCSAQEGLSWTVLQAMACGTPVIGSRTTAQTELLENAGTLITPKELLYIPIPTQSGDSHVSSWVCTKDDIKTAILDVSQRPDLRIKMEKAGLKRSKEWLSDVSDINDTLSIKPIQAEPISALKKEKVLFIQHSAAGDVLMTTRCLKGIKERYNLPVDFMTMPQYVGILENNPYINEIIPWNERKPEGYRFVLNPHGDKILPGSWGRNATSILSDFYWKILDVIPDDFYIIEKPIKGWQRQELPICIVQTSGGDKEFRTYKFMKDVCAGLKHRYTTVQLGAESDYPAYADIDLREKTSYAETAWLLKQAKVAITIDSYLSHLAGAIGISQICLFGSGNYRVVRPNQTKGMLICRVPDYTLLPCLGPCSASVRDCKLKCTGVHDPYDILEDIDEIEEHGLAVTIEPSIVERIS